MEICNPVLQFLYVALEASYFTVVARRAQSQACQFLRLMLKRLLQKGVLCFKGVQSRAQIALLPARRLIGGLVRGRRIGPGGRVAQCGDFPHPGRKFRFVRPRKPVQPVTVLFQHGDPVGHFSQKIFLRRGGSRSCGRMICHDRIILDAEGQKARACLLPA